MVIMNYRISDIQDGYRKCGTRFAGLSGCGSMKLPPEAFWSAPLDNTCNTLGYLKGIERYQTGIGCKIQRA